MVTFIRSWWCAFLDPNSDFLCKFRCKLLQHFCSVYDFKLFFTITVAKSSLKRSMQIRFKKALGYGSWNTCLADDLCILPGSVPECYHSLSHELLCISVPPKLCSVWFWHLFCLLHSFILLHSSSSTSTPFSSCHLHIFMFFFSINEKVKESFKKRNLAHLQPIYTVDFILHSNRENNMPSSKDVFHRQK